MPNAPQGPSPTPARPADYTRLASEIPVTDWIPPLARLYAGGPADKFGLSGAQKRTRRAPASRVTAQGRAEPGLLPMPHRPVPGIIIDEWIGFMRWITLPAPLASCAAALLVALLANTAPTLGATGTALATAEGPQATTTPSGDDYQLGAADKVRIIVFDEPTLSGEFTVNANGALSLPLIGDVPVRGLTPTQVAARIRDALKGGYLLEPKVSIDVLTFRPFYILGEVNKPGEYPYSSGLTVDAAVAMAEGYTYRAEKKRVQIRHAGEEAAHKLVITPDLRVHPGDIIRIGERYW